MRILFSHVVGIALPIQSPGTLTAGGVAMAGWWRWLVPSGAGIFPDVPMPLLPPGRFHSTRPNTGISLMAEPGQAGNAVIA